MPCLTAHTTLDEVERLKLVLVRKGEDDANVRVDAVYSQVVLKTDIPLQDESFLIYVNYPSDRDMLTLAQCICERCGANDCLPIARQILDNTDTSFIDTYFALLFGAWISVNNLLVDDLISLNEKTAKYLMELAWTHAPSHIFPTSELASAVKVGASFEGGWDTSQFKGPKGNGESVESMVENLTYAGEPVSDVLGRLKKHRFTSFEKRCKTDLKKASFQTVEA